MAKHRKPTTTRVNPMLGGALLAGGMLIAVPAAVAAAAPGVNGRPPLKPAANVEKIQEAGDNFFDNHPFADGSGAGALYHAVYGRSLDSAKALDDTATEGTNGLYAGVRNVVPRAGTCNVFVQTGC